MKARFVVPALLLLALGAWYLYVASSHQQPPRRSIRDLDTTYYATVNEWLPFYTEYLPNGTGWALLPKQDPAALYADARGRADVITPDICGECHEENYAGWQTTAHAKTSSMPTRETVLGSFGDGMVTMQTSDPHMRYEMSAEADGLFQTVVLERDGSTYSHRQRIDIVTGSGSHGQSYLYWQGDRLYQLPISYFTDADRWTTSPGNYVDGTADFARPILERCLDCHATWFASASQTDNRFDKSNFVLGVACVRCHGPGRQHVDFHRANPDATEGRHIVNPSSLAVERTNVVCAQCHSGVGVLRQPAFSYKPGDPLADYVRLDFEEAKGMNDDPHAANQLARMRRSACFVKSGTMRCTTCHNPHRHERGDLPRFSSHCIECHAPSDCGQAPVVGPTIKDDCISCHMPLTEELTSPMVIEGKRVMPRLRDHYIKVWPEVTKRVLKARAK